MTVGFFVDVGKGKAERTEPDARRLNRPFLRQRPAIVPTVAVLAVERRRRAAPRLGAFRAPERL